MLITVMIREMRPYFKLYYEKGLMVGFPKVGIVHGEGMSPLNHLKQLFYINTGLLSPVEDLAVNGIAAEVSFFQVFFLNALRPLF